MNAATQLVTMQDLATRWQCSKGKVHRMWRNGEIKPAVQSCRLVRFDLAAVEKSLAGKNADVEKGTPMTNDDGYQELFAHLAGGKRERAKEKADDRLHPTLGSVPDGQAWIVEYLCGLRPWLRKATWEDMCAKMRDHAPDIYALLNARGKTPNAGSDAPGENEPKLK